MIINNSEVVAKIDDLRGTVVYKCSDGKWYIFNEDRKELCKKFFGSEYMETETSDSILELYLKIYKKGIKLKGYEVEIYA